MKLVMFGIDFAIFDSIETAIGMADLHQTYVIGARIKNVSYSNIYLISETVIIMIYLSDLLDPSSIWDEALVNFIPGFIDEWRHFVRIWVKK